MMKKCILLLFFVSSVSLWGQNAYSFRYSWGVISEIEVNRIHLLEESTYSSCFRPTASVGAFVQLPVSRHFSVEPQIKYNPIRSKVSDGQIGHRPFKMVSHVVEIPVQCRYNICSLNDYRLFCLVEPFIGYTIMAKAEGELLPYPYEWAHDVGIAFTNDIVPKDHYTPFEYGVGMGIGIEGNKYKISLKYSQNLNSIGRDCKFRLFQVEDGFYQTVSLSIGYYL